MIAGHVDSLDRAGGLLPAAGAPRKGPRDPHHTGRRDPAPVRGRERPQLPQDVVPHRRPSFGPVLSAALRLITRGGDFDRASRSYHDNLVVFAHLA